MKLGSFLMYNKALSQTEILKNYNTQKGRYGFDNMVSSGLKLNLNSQIPLSYTGGGNSFYDLSGNNNTGTLTNGPTFDSITRSIVFDGTDDYVVGPNIGSLSTFTVDCWFYPTSNPGNSAAIITDIYTSYLNYVIGWGNSEVGSNTFFGGLGGVAGVGSNFFVTPLSYNVAAIQEAELANDILFSAYSFELINNKLKVFPVPNEYDDGINFWFEYIIKSERYVDSIQTGSGEAGAGFITNVSNMPYNNPVYSQINSIGRSWIFEYTLGQTKEMLGYVRNKYSSIPIPGASVTLNGGDLITSAKDEKDRLITRLREYFDETSRKARLERRKDEAEFAKSELSNVPMTIYIG
jgi:hypothetical protein